MGGGIEWHDVFPGGRSHDLEALGPNPAAGDGGGGARWWATCCSSIRRPRHRRHPTQPVTLDDIRSMRQAYQYLHEICALGRG
jgi:hypothetical protein